MPEPRYRPRDFCLDPKDFGKPLRVEWVAAGNERDVALRQAARLQHLYAIRIRDRARERARERARQKREGLLVDTGEESPESPLQELARRMGCSHARLMRCLRGEVVMRLDDIGWADVVLGGVSELERTAATPPAGPETSPRVTAAR